MTQLLPGDLLLWRESPEASAIERLIGWGERQLGDQVGPASYYHVGFVSNDQKMFYQSKPPSIRLSPIVDPLPAYIQPFRLKVAPTSDQLKAIFSYADSRLGRWYDFVGVLTAGWVEFGGLEFCSKYTLDSFAAGQIVLTSKVLFPTPDDIANSSLISAIQ